MLTTANAAALKSGAVAFSEGYNMKVELTRGVAIAGVHHDIGEVVEVDDALGRQLVAMRKAQAPVAKPAKGKKSAKAD